MWPDKKYMLCLNIYVYKKVCSYKNCMLNKKYVLQ